MTTTAYERLLDALRAAGSRVVARGESAMAQCPGHDDNNPSLSVRAGDGRVLLYCHAGCEPATITAAIGWTARDLFDQPTGVTYDYRTADGLTTLRTVTRTPEKRFRQAGQTKGTSPLYRLPEVVAAVAAGEPVYLVEGEQDADTARLMGATGTTAPGGATNFHLADVEPLRGARVVAVVDRDAAGEKWAALVAGKLAGVAAEVLFTEAAAGKDLTDHYAAGHGLDELVPLDPQSAGTEAVSRRARITWADTIEPEPVTWAWGSDPDGRIPAGSLSVAAGREGTGKSSFGIWMAAQITRGLLPGSFHGVPRSVFYVAVEDSWKHTLVPRLLAAGADLARVGRFEVVTEADDEVTLSLPHDNVLLEREITRHGVALVVLDPLMSVIGDRIDTHREREVRSALDPLAKLADRTGAVLLGIAHFNKGSGTDAASLITGSGAFKNVPRSVFGFARDDADENGGRVMSQVKNSLGRDDLPSLTYTIESAEITTRKGIATTGRFTFTGESDRSVMDVLRDSRSGGDDGDERAEAAAWLVDYLTERGGAAPAVDVLKSGQAAGFARDQLKRAKGRRVKSEKSSFGGGWQWSLTDSTETGTRQERTKGAKSAGDGTPLPSLPSLLPSPPADPERTCPGCGGVKSPGVRRCVDCALSAAARPTPAEGSTCVECGELLTDPGALARCRPHHGNPS